MPNNFNSTSPSLNSGSQLWVARAKRSLAAGVVGVLQAASPVSTMGRILGDPKPHKNVRSGAEITVEKVISA